MDFDEVLKEVGGFGLYQKIIICFVLLPATLPCALHAYSQLFIAAIPKHWCHVPELEPWSTDYLDLVKNLSIPFKTNNSTMEYSQCEMYERNYSELVRYLEYRTPYQLQQDKVWEIGSPTEISKKIRCQHGWHYDRDIYPNTVVSEWNLVCENGYLVTLALVMFAIGGLLGNYLFGYLQDIWGRRPSFYAYLLLEIIACAGGAFVWDYYSWLTLRFIVGWTVPAILSSPYVLAIELVGPKRRVFCTIVTNIAYSCGLVALSGVVYVVRDWRFLSLAVSVPLLLLFSCFFILPESPRWLIAVGKHHRAAKILKSMARLNGCTISSDFLYAMEQKLIRLSNTQSGSIINEKSYGIRDIFRTPNMRKKTYLITFIWFTIASVYVGLSYYAPALGGDEIWNFFVSGAVELPTYLLLWPGLNYCGRRCILCISMLCGGIACVNTILFEHKHSIMFALYCIGKMGISSAFVVLPLMASELYPTVVRGLGMSFSAVIAMIGPILIPIINHMGENMLVLPLMIMGGLLIIGGFASFFLPETRNKHLPQTIEDGEAIPLNNFFGCFCCCSKLQTSAEENVMKNSNADVNNRRRVVCRICKKEIQKKNTSNYK